MTRQLRTIVLPWTEVAGCARLLRKEQRFGRNTARGSNSSLDAPLLIDGVSIIELSEGLAAPYAARLLGDLGADVLKVETPAGDPTRRREPFWPGEQGRDASALFAYLNAGKRRATLDFDARSDIEKLHVLLRDAAILVENQPVGRLQALGIDGPSLRGRHPHLVVLSINPFGRNGPLIESPATDFILQHRAAFAYGMARPVDDPASRGPLAGADHEGPLAVGVTGAMAAMWGLLVAQAGGTAPHIDLASYDFYSLIAFDALAQWLAGERAFSRHRIQREGSEAAGGLTWILPCAGGWVMVSPREQHQWDRWVDLLGNPSWSRDASFCGTRVDRRRNWFELQACMSEWTETLPPEEVARQAQNVSVACFPVSTPSESLRNAQLQHRRFFDRLVSPAGAETSVPGLPFRVEVEGRGCPTAGPHPPSVGPQCG